MAEEIDYQLANLMRKESRLGAVRAELPALSGEKALNAILDYSQPVTLVQSFPEQDLHFLMYHIGVDDFLPVLSMASSEQWEYLLDVELWDGDRLNLIQMTRNFNMLFNADPQRLLRWTIKEKPDFLEYYFFRHMDIRIREHDEDPGDFGNDFITIDDVIYFRFPGMPSDLNKNHGTVIGDENLEDENGGGDHFFSDADYDEEDIAGGTLALHHQATESLITRMLNTLADMDMSVYQGVMLETASVIPAETEEEQFRLRNVRLAEKGFLPRHEAAGIYQPLKIKDLRKRPEKYLTRPFWGTDFPRCAQYPSSFLKNQTLFARSIALLDNEQIMQNFQMEFAALVNGLISADGLKIRAKEDLEKAVDKACNYLSLGIELIHAGHLYCQKCLSWGEYLCRIKDKLCREDFCCRPEHGILIIANHAMLDIFKVASGAGMELKKRANDWYKKSWMAEKGLSLTFLGEHGLGIAGGLLVDFPLYFDNYETDVLYRPFASIHDISRTSQMLEGMIELDRVIAKINPDYGDFPRGRLTAGGILLTLWARNRIGLEVSFSPIAIELFRPFFQELFSGGGQEESGDKKTIINGSRVINGSRKNDFIEWIRDVTYGEGYDFSPALLGCIDSLFAQIEEEYGRVNPRDLDERFIFHFYIGAVA